LAINQQSQDILNTVVMGRESFTKLCWHPKQRALTTAMEIIEAQRGDEALQYRSAGKQQRTLALGNSNEEL